MSNDIQQQKPAAVFRSFLDKHKDQLAMALPKHINPDRMARLALTAFSQNRQLQNCDPTSVFGAVVMASQMGLEIGINGAAYIIPYGNRATFVPGWKGLVDLVSRTGRATVWTGAVFKGDDFDYALGDRPFVKHRPRGEDDPNLLEYVYAVGRVNGSDWPVIEVWPVSRVEKHFRKYNKVGQRHYAHENWEMYARKIPLLQVLKYMPSSVELTAALTADHAIDEGRTFTYDGDVLLIDGDEADAGQQQGGSSDRGTAGLRDQVAKAKGAAAQQSEPEAKAEPKAEAQDKAQPEQQHTAQRRRPGSGGVGGGME